jgi:hypothetical protein
MKGVYNHDNNPNYHYHVKANELYSSEYAFNDVTKSYRDAVFGLKGYLSEYRASGYKFTGNINDAEYEATNEAFELYIEGCNNEECLTKEIEQ